MILLLCAKNSRTKGERNTILKLLASINDNMTRDKTINVTGTRETMGKIVVIDPFGEAVLHSYIFDAYHNRTIIEGL